MKGIILASHGPMAKGTYETMQWFIEDLKQVKYLCLEPSIGPDEFTKKISETIQEVDDGEGVIVVCDLLFGSPCNCAAGLLTDNLEVLTGMNLAMVIELLNQRNNNCIDLDEIEVIAKNGVKNLRTLLGE